MIIKKKIFNEIQEIQKWNGKGTKYDPIIMDFAHNFIEYLILKSIKIPIIIKNLQADIVSLKDCQSITIKDSQIRFLYLRFCSKIFVEENKVKEMQAPFSRDCLIRNNKLHAYNLNFESINNDVEHLIFEENFINFFVLSLLSLISGLGLIFLGLINFHSSGEGLINLGIIILILSGFSVLPAIYTKYRISKMKNLPNNEYENNLPYN